MTLSAHLQAILSGSVRIAQAAPVTPPRDRRPVFEPSHTGAPRAARFAEMPELETHDMVLCDNNTDFLSIGQAID